MRCLRNNRIEILRKEKRITLAELARLTGLSAGYLCHLEKGSRSNPSLEVMEKIAKALNKSVVEIFFIQF